MSEKHDSGQLCGSSPEGGSLLRDAPSLFSRKKKNSNFFEFGAFGGGKKAQQREIMGEAEEEELQELQELQGELAGAGSGHKTPRQAAGAASHRG